MKRAYPVAITTAFLILLAPLAATAARAEVQVTYNRGLHLKSEDGAYALRIRFMFQPHFTAAASNTAADRATFTIRRGQMRFAGHFPSSAVQYKLMVEAAGSGKAATLNLRDLWVNWKPIPGFQVRFGQFFVYFDRENLQPAWGLQFVDRSTINKHLGFERDQGVDVSGRLGRAAYHVFAMNGEGRNQVNSGTNLVYGCRVSYDLLGRDTYLPGDLDRSRTPQVALAGAALLDPHNDGLGGDGLLRLQADVALRYSGASAVGIVNRSRCGTRDQHDSGFLVQGGFFVVPKRFEVALRRAWLEQGIDAGTGTTDTTETGVAASWFLDGHWAKIQADYRVIDGAARVTGRRDRVFRLQTQLFF